MQLETITVVEGSEQFNLLIADGWSIAVRLGDGKVILNRSI